MKKLLLATLVCFWGIGAMAQLPVTFGIHGGVSNNRIKVRDIFSSNGTKTNSGFTLGGFMRINMGKLYLEPSLNFSHKKSTVKRHSHGEEENNVDLKMNTLDIPLMLGFQVLDLSLFQLRTFIGPVFSTGRIKNMKRLGDDVTVDNTYWHGRIGVGIDLWKLAFDINYEKAFKDPGHNIKSPRSFNFTLGLKII